MKVSVWVFVDASSVIILAMMLMHEYSKAGERKKKVSSSHSRIFWCFLSVGFWVAPCRNWEFCGEVDAAVEAWSMPRESFCLLHIWDIMLLQSSFYFGKKKSCTVGTETFLCMSNEKSILDEWHRKSLSSVQHFTQRSVQSQEATLNRSVSPLWFWRSSDRREKTTLMMS